MLVWKLDRFRRSAFDVLANIASWRGGGAPTHSNGHVGMTQRRAGSGLKRLTPHAFFPRLMTQRRSLHAAPCQAQDDVCAVPELRNYSGSGTRDTENLR